MKSLKENLKESNCHDIECCAVIVANIINEGKKGGLKNHFKKHGGKYALGLGAVGVGLTAHTLHGITKEK